ncbi:MAG: penicillin-binding protein 1C [Bdellovibrionales bacterium]|nr:penicillin-binding protein 1C [Ramlibacter sp.]
MVPVLLPFPFEEGGGEGPLTLTLSQKERKSECCLFQRQRGLTALLFAFTALTATTAHALPTYTEVRTAHQPSDTLILDRNGEVIQRLRTDSTVRRGQWVALQDISPALRTAMVLSEDQHFYEHSGVDWRAASAAAWGNLWNSKTRGASTITMQLAGLLDGGGYLQRSARGRSVAQKLGQTVAAQVLDRRWRKDQILEAYLNLVPFRGEVVGIDALSRTLFGKAAHGLDEREAAVAAALVRAPNAKVQQVTQRACGVLKAMQPGGTPGCDGLDMFATAALQRRDFEASEGIAPHLARRVLAESMLQGSGASATIRSTLSAPLQRFAVETLQRHLRELHGRHVEDGALVVLDNASGNVLAWVGSSGELSQASEVDGVMALRQPGSTLKPFLYAQALAERRITAASLLEDSPTHIPTASGLYIPQNYDRQFKGWVSARTALAASLNVPAVRTLVMVSPDAFARQLKAAGLPLREGGDYYGYSLALGSAEVPLLNLTNAYRTLANGGRYGPATTTALQAVIPARAPAIDPRAAFIVGDILSDSNARARTFGTASVLATRFWSAVKTGTSKDMRDNWAIGWSQRYTVGVWVGNARGAPMWDVSGTSGAAPVWAAVMQHLHANTPSRAPQPPAGLVQARAAFGSELEAARSEWFMEGTAQALFNIDTPSGTSGHSAPLHITAPASGTIVALDPDIPPNRQRLSFKASASGRWLLDGQPFASGAQAQWLPWPGRHVMQLANEKGEVQDEVRVEVRGAGVKAGLK